MCECVLSACNTLSFVLFLFLVTRSFVDLDLVPGYQYVMLLFLSSSANNLKLGCVWCLYDLLKSRLQMWPCIL